MARLRFCFCTLVLLLSFCVSETRPLRNHDPISFHLPSNSLFLSTVKHYLYPGSEDRSLAKMDKLSTSAKVSFSIKWIRSSNATRSQYHQPLRVSPGGPDAHHHFKVTVSGEHGRRQINCVHEVTVYNERDNKGSFHKIIGSCYENENKQNYQIKRIPLAPEGSMRCQ